MAKWTLMVVVAISLWMFVGVVDCGPISNTEEISETDVNPIETDYAISIEQNRNKRKSSVALVVSIHPKGSRKNAQPKPPKPNNNNLPDNKNISDCAVGQQIINSKYDELIATMNNILDRVRGKSKELTATEPGKYGEEDTYSGSSDADDCEYGTCTYEDESGDGKPHVKPQDKPQDKPGDDESNGSYSESEDTEKIKITQIETSLEISEESSEETITGKGGKHTPGKGYVKPKTTDAIEIVEDSEDIERIKIKETQVALDISEESSEEIITGKYKHGKDKHPQIDANESEQDSIDIEKLKIIQEQTSVQISEESSEENYGGKLISPNKLRPNHENYPKEQIEQILNESTQDDESSYTDSNLYLLKKLLNKRKPGVTKNISKDYLEQLLDNISNKEDVVSGNSEHKFDDKVIKHALNELLNDNDDQTKPSDTSVTTTQILTQLLNHASDESDIDTMEILKDILNSEIYKNKPEAKNQYGIPNTDSNDDDSDADLNVQDYLKNKPDNLHPKPHKTGPVINPDTDLGEDSDLDEDLQVYLPQNRPKPKQHNVPGVNLDDSEDDGSLDEDVQQYLPHPKNKPQSKYPKAPIVNPGDISEEDEDVQGYLPYPPNKPNPIYPHKVPIINSDISLDESTVLDEDIRHHLHPQNKPKQPKGPVINLDNLSGEDSDLDEDVQQYLPYQQNKPKPYPKVPAIKPDVFGENSDSDEDEQQYLLPPQNRPQPKNPKAPIINADDISDEDEDVQGYLPYQSNKPKPIYPHKVPVINADISLDEDSNPNDQITGINKKLEEQDSKWSKAIEYIQDQLQKILGLVCVCKDENLQPNLKRKWLAEEISKREKAKQVLEEPTDVDIIPDDTPAPPKLLELQVNPVKTSNPRKVLAGPENTLRKPLLGKKKPLLPQYEAEETLKENSRRGRNADEQEYEEQIVSPDNVPSTHIFDTLEGEEENAKIKIERPISFTEDFILYGPNSAENVNFLSDNNNYNIDLEEFLRDKNTARANNNPATPSDVSNTADNAYATYAKEIGDIFDTLESDGEDENAKITIERPISFTEDFILYGPNSTENVNFLSDNNNYGIDLEEFLRELAANNSASANNNPGTPSGVSNAAPSSPNSSTDDEPLVLIEPNPRIVRPSGPVSENKAPCQSLRNNAGEETVIVNRGDHKIPMKLTRDENGQLHLVLNRKCVCKNCRRRSRKPSNNN